MKPEDGGLYRKDKKGVKEDYDRVILHFPVLAKGKINAGTLSGGEQQSFHGESIDDQTQASDDGTNLRWVLSPLLVREIFRIIKTINGEGTTILSR